MEFGGSTILRIMLPTHMVATAVTSVLLLITGSQTLTPPAQPVKQEVIVGTSVYPVADGALIPWKVLLSRDPELYELSNTCEDPGLDPLARNLYDATITGYPSYGILSYQPGTFLAGVKKYNAYPGAIDKPVKLPDQYLQDYADKRGLGNVDRQILAAIYDPYLQIYVGRHMINDNEGHQWTCYNTLKLAQKYPVWKTTSEAVSKNLN